MEMDDIKTKLRDYIRERYEVPEGDEDFTDDVHLFDYGYVDSFGAVDLIRFVESAFSVTVGQSDLVAYPLNTVNEISDFVAARIPGGANAQVGR
jgi:D-alanine--poly(phosphoribitol) ligase subunit 2